MTNMKQTKQWLIIGKSHITDSGECLTFSEIHEPPIGVYYLFNDKYYMCLWEEFEKVLENARSPAEIDL